MVPPGQHPGSSPGLCAGLAVYLDDSPPSGWVHQWQLQFSSPCLAVLPPQFQTSASLSHPMQSQCRFFYYRINSLFFIFVNVEAKRAVDQVISSSIRKSVHEHSCQHLSPIFFVMCARGKKITNVHSKVGFTNGTYCANTFFIGNIFKGKDFNG